MITQKNNPAGRPKHNPAANALCTAIFMRSDMSDWALQIDDLLTAQ